MLAVAPPPDPYQIYAQARAVWASQRYPAFLAYTIAVSVDERGTQKTRHYRAFYDAADDRVHVYGVSEEEQQSPHVPDGINLSVDPKRNFHTLFSKRVGSAEEAVDYLGVPMLAPNYSFGIEPYVPPSAATQADQAALVEAVRREFDDPMPSDKAAQLDEDAAPKEIGHVVSTERAYRITYDGLQPIDGSDAYHLLLQPLRAPDEFRLREIWIDPQTFTTRAILTQGNFAGTTPWLVNSALLDEASRLVNVPLLGTVPWLVTFSLVDGAQYISSEEALRPVRVGAHTYDRAAIAFQGIRAEAGLSSVWHPLVPPAGVLREPSQNL